MKTLVEKIKYATLHPRLFLDTPNSLIFKSGVVCVIILVIWFFIWGNKQNHNTEIFASGDDVTIVITKKQNTQTSEFFVYCFIIDDTKKEEFVLPVKENEYKEITIGDKYKAKYIPGDYTLLPFWDSKQNSLLSGEILP